VCRCGRNVIISVVTLRTLPGEGRMHADLHRSPGDRSKPH
jgi:hypothetical protein